MNKVNFVKGVGNKTHNLKLHLFQEINSDRCFHDPKDNQHDFLY